MAAYRSGSDFSFMTSDSTATLRPVAFGGRKCRGNEVRLHSHLGEGFAGDWAINKCRHMLFGQRFVWVTDCYAIRFILSYDGNNPAISRLQMRLMCWDVDIVHRPDTALVDADYWSCLGMDLDYDPLLRDYLAYALERCNSNPPPTDLPMHPENMPYFRGPRIQEPTDAAVSADALHIQSLVTEIVSTCTFCLDESTTTTTLPPPVPRSTRPLRRNSTTLVKHNLLLSINIRHPHRLIGHGDINKTISQLLVDPLTPCLQRSPTKHHLRRASSSRRPLIIVTNNQKIAPAPRFSGVQN